MKVKKVFSGQPNKFHQFEGYAEKLLNSVLGNNFDFGFKVEHQGKKGDSGDIEILGIRNHFNDETNYYRTEEYYYKWEADFDFNLIETNMQVQKEFLAGNYTPTIWNIDSESDNARYNPLLIELQSSQTKLFWDYKQDDIFNCKKYTLILGDSRNNHILQWCDELPIELSQLTKLFHLLKNDLEELRKMIPLP